MSFIDECLSWNDVSIYQILFFLLYVVIQLIYVFQTMNPPFSKEINNYIDNTCFIKCNSELCKKITKLRDANYLLNRTDQPKTCLFTLWELSHMLFHVVLGYFFNIYISVTASMIWEIFEHYYYDCGSILDLFYNSIGLFIGILLRYSHKCNK